MSAARIRVLVLTNMYPYEADPSFGTFVHAQVRALRELGVDIDVLFVNGRASRWGYVMGCCRFWRQLAFVRYDLIHAHYVFSGWIARAQLHLPIVQSFHGAGEMFGYQGWLCKRLAPLVDEVIVTSAQHKAELGHEEAHVIPCGVDLDLFSPRPRDEACGELGWEPSRSAVIWVGDPRPEKRLGLIHTAYDLLRQRRDNVDLHVVTKVPHTAIPTYMNAADVLVLASDFEGSPVVIKEAMACNLPIVSTAVGDVPEVIGDMEGCFLAEQNAEDLAANLDLALSFGRRTRGREVIQHLQVRGEAERIRDLYEKVVARRRNRMARVGGPG